jgi:hypothetical protein
MLEEPTSSRMKSIDRFRHNSKVRVVEFIHCFQIPTLVLLAIITKPSILQMSSVKLFFCSFIQPYPSHAETVSIETNARCLVTGSPRLSNDTLQLIDLRLGTSESTELFMCQYIVPRPNFCSDIPSSWPAYAHACPYCFGGVR